MIGLILKPFTGTALVTELMYMVYHKADVASARATFHAKRIRFLEHALPFVDPLKDLMEKEPPRLLKTHLPATFFQKQIQTPGVKVVQLIRNPRDMLVTMFHFYKKPDGYVKFPGTWDEFFEDFKAKQLYGGDWFEHTKSYWALRDQPNVMFLFYEDVMADKEKALRAVADFCGQTLTDEEFARAAAYIHNEVGEDSSIGGWKEFFSKEQDAFFTELYQKGNARHPIAL
jgi:hypothetical protein